MKITRKLGIQITKFIIVGIINTGIDLAVLNFIIAVTHKGRHGFYFSLFKFISFTASTINSYFMHKYWTFAGTGSAQAPRATLATRATLAARATLGTRMATATSILKTSRAKAGQAAQFFSISLVGLVINVSIASLVVNYVHHAAYLDPFWPTVSALCGTSIGLIWNFIGYKLIVFSKQEHELLPPA